MVNPNRFYTYAYLREDKTPYYVGKGQGNRAYKKHWRSKSRGGYFTPPEKNRIIILKNNLTEKNAYKHEMYMINVFGRKDLGTGILRNMSNGGEGASGVSPWNKGKKGTCSPQQIDGNRQMMKERYKNGYDVCGANNPRAKTWRIVYNNGEEIIVGGLQRWAVDNGYSTSGIKNIAYGKWKTYKDLVVVEEVAHKPPIKVRIVQSVPIV
jgi:hypothetical protein